MEAKQYKVAIPKGYRIYFKAIDIAGAHHKKNEIIHVMRAKTVKFVLEPEPTNPYDSNAIKVIAIKKGWFFSSSFHIGYIPKNIAKQICDKSLLLELIPRPKRAWFGDRGGISFSIDLLGTKANYSSFQSE
ncbi:HIRAN domain-containing protein [Vibrio mytili]|uniref:HIRAN domain-containing protein n=1 Tax=Vibrio mytili TaxID=50718 RepID=UPI003C6F0D3A